MDNQKSNVGYDPLDGELHPEDIEAHVKRKNVEELLLQKTGGGKDADVCNSSKNGI